MTWQLGSWTLSFLPHVPWLVVWLCAAVGALAVGAMLYGRMRGALLRAMALVLLLGALANPQLAQDEREQLSDIAAVIVDDSDSQSFGERRAQTEAALEEVRQRVAALGNTELRIGRTVTGNTPDTDGTRVFAALSRLTADIPPDRYAGAIVISDGQVHDVPRHCRYRQTQRPHSHAALGQQGGNRPPRGDRTGTTLCHHRAVS